MANKYLDYDGLLYFWQKIKTLFSSKAEGVKTITRSGTTFTVTRADDTTFTFTQQDNTVAKTSTTPKANGTAAIGSETKYAAGDHVHPLQTTVSGNAGTATKLATARNIDGVSFDGSANIIHYGSCSTAAGTTAKAVSCTGFALETGAWIAVKFTVTNTGAVGSLQLNVNSTGAKAIKYRGGNLPSTATLTAGRTYLFVYDGTNYELVGDLDTNTTYTAASATPSMDGTGAVGSSAKYAREDHVHPSDTSRVPTTRKVNGKALSSDININTDDIDGAFEASLTDDLGVLKAADDAMQIRRDLSTSEISLTTNATIGTSGEDTVVLLTREAIENAMSNLVAKETGKGLSTNDYTTAEKTKLSGIATGAEVNQNAFSNVTVGSTTVAADSKTDTLTLSAGTNISITANASNDAIMFEVDEMPGRYSVSEQSGGIVRITDTQTLPNVNFDTAAIASPTFTGTPKAPTATAGTNTTQIATTAFVQSAVSTAVTGATAYQGIAPTSFAPTNYKAGWYWIIGTAGTYCGQTCEAGDMIFCKAAASAYAAANFDVVQTNLDITSITNAEIDTILAA